MSQGVLTFKVDTSKAQTIAIDEAIRTTQFLRNRAIQVWETIKGTKRKELQRLSSILAKELAFVAKLNSSARQAALDRGWSSISRFYDNCRKNKPGKKGYPKYKYDVRSVEYKTSGWGIAEDFQFIEFTDGNNIGWLHLRNSTPSNHDTHYDLSKYSVKDIKRVRLLRLADGYYVQLIIKGFKNPFQKNTTGNVLAFDAGSTDYITDHTGKAIACPKWLAKGEKRLKRLQRVMSRRKKGSQNRKKIKIQLAKQHLSISRQREDFARKLARTLHQSNDWIFCENLSLHRMIESGICSKSMSDAGLGIFFQWLDYYKGLGGAEVEKVNAAYSTWECNACEHLVPKKLEDRWHECPKCGCSLPRDHNSALVIMKRGIRQILGTAGKTDSLESLDKNDPMILKTLMDLEPLVSMAKALDIKL